MNKNKLIILISIIAVIVVLAIIIAYIVLNGIGSSSSSLNSQNIGNMASVNEPSNSQSNIQTGNNQMTNNENSITIEGPLPEIPEYNFYFELPIKGASGYASIEMDMLDIPKSSTVVKKLNAGDGFKILEEYENWWKIQIDNVQGWVDTTYCMINLPDIIPSIIYDNTNSYQSLFKSSGFNIDNITGKKLYDVYFFNERLAKKEYVMPVIYSMAKKIMTAQKNALKDGYSLKIYETYRPYDTQQKVCTNLKALLNSNTDVYDGIYSDGWNENWFINSNISDHQKGTSIDVTLVKYEKYALITLGKYKYVNITDYNTLRMPTGIHELSKDSAVFREKVSSSSSTEWKNATFVETITDDAKRLQKYCTDASLVPIASEWWHFSDLDAKNTIGEKFSDGKYNITECFSVVPN